MKRDIFYVDLMSWRGNIVNRLIDVDKVSVLRVLNYQIKPIIITTDTKQ